MVCNWTALSGKTASFALINQVERMSSKHHLSCSALQLRPAAVNYDPAQGPLRGQCGLWILFFLTRHKGRSFLAFKMYDGYITAVSQLHEDTFPM